MSIQNISLSGRKKQVSNKEMTLGERLYIGAIAGGMATTFKHLFKKIIKKLLNKFLKKKIK